MYHPERQGKVYRFSDPDIIFITLMRLDDICETGSLRSFFHSGKHLGLDICSNDLTRFSNLAGKAKREIA